MATWDNADLLLRVQNLLSRPTTDALFTDTKIYSWLTEAEAYWKPIIAAHAPQDMWTAPALMTAVGDGKTFTFPSSAVGMLRVQIMRSSAYDPLKPGAIWDVGSDYVLENGLLRIAAGREMTFPDGAPYVRLITEPGDIDASTQSTILPKRARAMLPYTAAEIACRTGAAWGDPSYFEERADKLAWGAPDLVGDVGIIGQLKVVNHDGGMASMHGGLDLPYWRPNG